MGIARVARADTPYHVSELDGVRFDQTATELYTVSLDKPVHRLTRASHTDWTWEPVVFGPNISPPAGLAGTPSYGDGGAPADPGHNPTAYKYVVTGVKDQQESRASADITVTNDLSLDGNYNQLTWTAGAYDRYILYKENNGVYGYIGGTEGTTFRDQNITADLTTTPPKGANPFAAAGDYPSTIAFHGQRAYFGRTRNLPNGVWGTQVRFVENMDAAEPARGDDALSFAIRGTNVNAINQLVSSASLLVLTSDSIYSVTGQGDRAGIGPDGNIVPAKQTRRNASRLRPIEIDSVVFYEPRTERGVRALGYTYDVDGYKSNDVSIFSAHLFQDDTIKSWAYQAFPGSIVWAVTWSGALLAFTWQQEHEVWGWTRCVTSGVYEDVVAVAEGGVDRVYCIVRRTLRGEERRVVERVALPSMENVLMACPLDCAVTYAFEDAQQVVGGLWHLEGETVSAYADGFSVSGLEVVQGQVTLPQPANVVAVGLPFECTLRGLPPALTTQQGVGAVNSQTVSDIVLKLRFARGVEVGVGPGDDDDALEQIAPYHDEFIGTGDTTDERGAVTYKVPTTARWSDGYEYVVKQREASPAQVLGLFISPVVATR